MAEDELTAAVRKRAEALAGGDHASFVECCMESGIDPDEGELPFYEAGLAELGRLGKLDHEREVCAKDPRESTMEGKPRPPELEAFVNVITGILAPANAGRIDELRVNGYLPGQGGRDLDVYGFNAAIDRAGAQVKGYFPKGTKGVSHEPREKGEDLRDVVRYGNEHMASIRDAILDMSEGRLDYRDERVFERVEDTAEVTFFRRT